MNTKTKWDTVLRDGEDRTQAYRSQRMFAIGSSWYFSTREGKEQGPFVSREIVEQAIKTYIQKHRVVNKSKTASHAVKMFDVSLQRA